MAVYEATDDTFDELIQKEFAIVDFSATHCGPCRALWPVLLGVQNELPFIDIVRVNTDNCPKLAERYKITSLPTVYLSKNGQMQEYQGSREPEDIRAAVGALLYE